MISFPTDIQRPVYWRSVTSFIVLLAAICCCNGVLHQKSAKIADPLQSASESSSTQDTTKLQETAEMDLGALLDAGDGAIVTLVAGDTRLAAHRAVLVAGSVVFAAMFRPDKLTDSSTEVDIPGMEGPVLRQLVAFLYTGRAPQLAGMGLQLLVAAEKYGVSALRDSIEPQVTEKLSVENAAATAVLALKYNSQSLSKAAIAFMRDHLEVLATRGWAEAVRKHPAEVRQIAQLLRKPSANTSGTTIADSSRTRTATSTASPTTTSATITTAAPTASTASAQPRSDHSRTATASSLTTAGRHTRPPNTAAVSRLHTTATTGTTPTPTAARTNAHTAATATTTTYRANPAAANSTPATTTSVVSTTGAPTATARPHSDHGWTGVAGTLTTAGHHTPPVDAAAVSLFRKLSAEEKGRKLIQAAGEGSVQQLRALLAAGADVRTRDGGGWTSLHWAADFGHLDVARYLLQAGADVNAKDRWQWTPLHWAADRGHTAMVQLLLGASADPNVRDMYGAMALHWAAVNGRAEVVAELLKAGADRAATTKKGQTPLDLARERKHPQVVQMLQ